jgi:pimeloyl-ACP methyl ester carboxylesterase
MRFRSAVATTSASGSVGSVEHVIDDVPMHYVEQGEGVPVLALHGAGVDHREVMGCLDPVFDASTGYRRIYPDLPGMGRTPAPKAIRGADDVLHVLLGFIDGVIGDRPMLVAGHSAGGYYAQAIASQRPHQVIGLALLCPLLAGIHDVPEHEVVAGSGSIGNAEFRDYFTVQTAGTFDRYERYVEPAARLVDESALARIGERWELSTRPLEEGSYRYPTLIVTGRQDSTVGYARAWEMLESFPRATFAVLDRAGHALPHEQPGLIRALVTEWLDRIHEHSVP